MSERIAKRGFAARPAMPSAGSRPADAASRDARAAAFTARLTIDVTPDLRGRIKIAAFRARRHRRRHAARSARARIPRQRWRPIMTGDAARARGGPRADRARVR